MRKIIIYAHSPNGQTFNNTKKEIVIPGTFTVSAKSEDERLSGFLPPDPTF